MGECRLQALSATNTNPLQAGVMPDGICGTQNAVLHSAYERGSCVRDVTLSLRRGQLAGGRRWRTASDCRRVSPLGRWRMPRRVGDGSAVPRHHGSVAGGAERSKSNPTVLARRSEVRVASNGHDVCTRIEHPPARRVREMGVQWIRERVDVAGGRSATGLVPKSKPAHTPHSETGR
jgi:hypothetical protein